MTALEKYKEFLKTTIIRGDVPLGESEEFKTFVSLLVEIQPKKLFRYRICNENSFSALLDDRIYFCSPTKFNDPHDCLVYVDRNKLSSLLYQADDISSIVKIMSNSRIFNNNFSPNDYPTIQYFRSKLPNSSTEESALVLDSIESMDASVRNRLRNEWHALIQKIFSIQRELARKSESIACFSEKFDSSLMWAHYAEYHKGFVLEYDTTELKGESIFSLFPVIYGNERYDATEYEIEILQWVKRYFFYGIAKALRATDQLHNIKSTTYKGSDWEYEKEWRLLHSFSENNTSKNYSVKPKAIYLGSKISESNKNVILKLIEGKNMSVYEMYVDESNREYALNHRIIPMGSSCPERVPNRHADSNN